MFYWNKNSVYLCIYHTPKVIRVYSTFILNFGITDFLACVTDFFVFQRYLDNARDFIEILNIKSDSRWRCVGIRIEWTLHITGPTSLLCWVKFF